MALTWDPDFVRSLINLAKALHYCLFMKDARFIDLLQQLIKNSYSLKGRAFNLKLQPSSYWASHVSFHEGDCSFNKITERQLKLKGG